MPTSILSFIIKLLFLGKFITRPKLYLQLLFMSYNLCNIHLNAHSYLFLHYNDARYYMKWTETSTFNKVVQHTCKNYLYIYISFTSSFATLLCTVQLMSFFILTHRFTIPWIAQTRSAVSMWTFTWKEISCSIISYFCFLLRNFGCYLIHKNK